MGRRLHLVQKQYCPVQPGISEHLQLAQNTVGVQALEHPVEVQMALQVHFAERHFGRRRELANQCRFPYLPRPAQYQRLPAACRQPSMQRVFSESLHGIFTRLKYHLLCLNIRLLCCVADSPARGDLGRPGRAALQRATAIAPHRQQSAEAGLRSRGR